MAMKILDSYLSETPYKSRFEETKRSRKGAGDLTVALSFSTSLYLYRKNADLSGTLH